MTLSGTSSVSPAFAAGTQSGPVFSPAVLPGSSRPGAESAKIDSASVATVDAAAASSKVAKAVSVAASSGTTAPSSSAAVSRPEAVSAATASSEASKAAAVKTEQASTASKSAVVGEDGQIRELRAQGQNLSQIAVDLNISVAAVNGDLQTDIPKFDTPPAAVESSDHSTISVFA